MRESDTANAARVYDYLLGGRNYYTADARAATTMLKDFPGLRTMAEENRKFLGRAVSHLAGRGVRQFLDIGTGLPTMDNVHQVAQRFVSSARVVYVDNDANVVTHAETLLEAPQPGNTHDLGRTDFLLADLREPQKILDSDPVRATLDFGEPIALLLIAVLHFLPDTDQPYAHVQTLMDGLPAGSFLVLSHATGDYAAKRIEAVGKTYGSQGIAGQARTRTEVDEFFTGLEPVPPGLQVISKWRPAADSGPRPSDEEVSFYGGIGRKA